MTDELKMAVRDAAVKAGLKLDGQVLLDEHGELLEAPVDLACLGRFLGVVPREREGARV